MVAQHPVLLRSASFGDGPGASQLILERTEREFIPAILDELARPGGTADLLRTRAAKRTRDNVLKLFQPVQRTFNIALFEVVCDVPGQPRFDPARIDSAGMVMRRVPRDDDGVPRFDDLEAWCQDGQALKGWLRLAECEELDRDPDATRRPSLSAGHAELDRRFALWRGVTRRLTETVTPLFPAPPDICRALGKTILFGVIPLASAEISEVPADGVFMREEFEEHLSLHFKASSVLLAVPRREEWLTADDAEDKRLESWINMLGQVLLEFDAFGDSRQSREIFALLQQIRVPLVMRHAVYDPEYRVLTYESKYADIWPSRPAGDLLREHAEVLVKRKPGSVRMPALWPQLSESVAGGLYSATKASIEARLAALLRPRQPRFDQRPRTPATRRPRRGRGTRVPAPPYADTGEMYRLRAFVRVRHEHCPPRTIWSEYSEAFTIAPWYEGTGAPPVQVVLPDPSDEKFLERLKPNVAFSVPPGLFNLLKGNPKDLLAGKGSTSGPSDAWICGFNIPIITICAFVALYIVLMLLNMIFFWLPLVKICIPLPRSLAPK